MQPRPTSRRLRDRPGRQIERTQLAWERSAVGLVAAATLLLFRHVAPLTSGRVVLAAADVGLALLLAWIGRRRARVARACRNRSGGTPVPDASREVTLVTAWAVALAVGTALLILFQT